MNCSWNISINLFIYLKLYLNLINLNKIIYYSKKYLKNAYNTAAHAAAINIFRQPQDVYDESFAAAFIIILFIYLF